jgi:hypothetical protein
MDQGVDPLQIDTFVAECYIGRNMHHIGDVCINIDLISESALISEDKILSITLG